MSSVHEICFTFDERRTVQACAVLFPEGRRENYTKLLKLLYLADRRSLIETGAPITGAHVVSMKNGPVLGDVYDCIKGDPGQSMWDDHIDRVGTYDLVLKKEPGDSELSDYDVEILTDLANKHRNDDWRTMIDVVHQLPEWRDPQKLNRKTVPLPASEILRAVGAAEETIAKVAEETNYHAAVERLFRLHA
jgi:uncharacterized phage-associated protein